MTHFITRDEPVLVWTGSAVLDGRLTIPEPAAGAVIVAALASANHHDGYRALAAELNDSGYATLTVDLLTPDEQQFDLRTGHFRSDILFVAGRITSVSRWLEQQPATGSLPQAFAASAIVAAAGILASASGQFETFAEIAIAPRLDLVRDQIPQLATPLLVVVGDGIADLQAEHDALGFRCEKRLVHVPNLTAFLEDEETRPDVTRPAAVWLREHELALVTA